MLILINNILIIYNIKITIKNKIIIIFFNENLFITNENIDKLKNIKIVL